MKKGLVLVGVIAGMFLLVNVLSVSAQGYGPGMMMGGGSHGAMMGAGVMHEQVWTAIATELGMSYDELVAAVQSGQTIAEIAEAQGVSLDDLQAAVLEVHQAQLAALVEQGVITQERADWMLERMASMPMFNLDFSGGFGPGACHGIGRGGMMNGGPRWAPAFANEG